MTNSLLALYIERCAQALEKVVIPNLTDNFASTQARMIAILLHSFAPRVEEKGKQLMTENDGMQEVLGKVLEVLRGEKTLSSNAVNTGLIKRLELELQKGETKHPDLSEENDRLKGALVEIIKGLDALSEALPIEKISSLRQQIRVVLRQQLDHELVRVAAIFTEANRDKLRF
jgi:hypothetical protein